MEFRRVGRSTAPKRSLRLDGAFVSRPIPASRRRDGMVASECPDATLADGPRQRERTLSCAGRPYALQSTMWVRFLSMATTFRHDCIVGGRCRVARLVLPSHPGE